MKKHSVRLLTLVSTLALLVTACQKPEDVAPPRQLIPRDKMVELLVQLHLLEARTDAAGLNTDSARALFREQQKSLYWRYNTNDSAFVQSFRFYAIHDKDLDDIYGSVIDSLARREGRSQPPHR